MTCQKVTGTIFAQSLAKNRIVFRIQLTFLYVVGCPGSLAFVCHATHELIEAVLMVGETEVLDELEARAVTLGGYHKFDEGVEPGLGGGTRRGESDPSGKRPRKRATAVRC
jgi:hypothetical protein